MKMPWQGFEEEYPATSPIRRWWIQKYSEDPIKKLVRNNIGICVGIGFVALAMLCLLLSMVVGKIEIGMVSSLALAMLGIILLGIYTSSNLGITFFDHIRNSCEALGLKKEDFVQMHLDELRALAWKRMNERRKQINELRESIPNPFDPKHRKEQDGMREEFYNLEALGLLDVLDPGDFWNV